MAARHANDNTKRIQLLKTAFVIYYHMDFAKAKQFLLDFGLSITQEKPGKEIYFKGYGSEPYVYVARQSETGQSYFGGAAYVVASRAELDNAARLNCSDGEVRKLDGPAGGEVVTLKDPIGHRVHLVHGWEEKEPEDVSITKLTINFESEKPRKGTFQRFNHGPAPVFRWGHYGVSYPQGDFQEMFDWYTNTISLAPSDILHRGEDPTTCFFHIDRGEEYTDHHSFYFKPTKPGAAPAVTHSAFEVHDFDVQQLGHQHLESQGYELCWGVGRVSRTIRCRCSPENAFD